MSFIRNIMQTRNAFTMVELVFVIVVIGILSAIAIPKLAATRDDAEITVGINTLASIRNSIATERQKRILRGDFTSITDLDAAGEGGISTFNKDKDGNENNVLEYPVKNGKEDGQWSKSNETYIFHFQGTSCKFVLKNNTLQVVEKCPEFGL